MSLRESSLEDRQREEPSTGAPALPSWELQLYVRLRSFFLCLYFFFFAGLRRFFLWCFLSRSVQESELSSLLDSDLLLLDLLCFCLTVLRIGDIANWFTVTTCEWTSDILVLAVDSLQLDEWIWTETGFISRALSCLCFSSNSKTIFLSSSATEGILLLQAIRNVAISFWSANFPPGVLGEYFSGNALSKRYVTAVAKAEILLDWNASRFFFSMFTFSISGVTSFSSRFLFVISSKCSICFFFCPHMKYEVQGGALRLLFFLLPSLWWPRMWQFPQIEL